MNEFSINSNTQTKQHQKQLFNKCLDFINLDEQTHLKTDKNWHYFDNLMHLREFRNPNVMKKTLIKENGTWKINKSKVHSQTTKNINFLFSSDQFQYHTKNQSHNGFRFKNQSNSIARPKEFNEIYNTRKKLSLFYGYFSTQKIQNLITKAKQYPGYFSKNFFALLEQRLDVALYRSGLAPSIMAARQICAHGKVQVNSQICTKSNTALKPGDIVTLLQIQNTKETLELKDEFVKILNTTKNSHNNSKKYYNRIIKNIIIGTSTISIVANTKIKSQNKLRFNLLLKLLLSSLRSRLSKNGFEFKHNSLVNSTKSIHIVLLKLKTIKKPKILYTLRNIQFRAYKNRKKFNKFVSSNTQIKRLFSTTGKENINTKDITLTQLNNTNSQIQKKLKNNIIFHFLGQYCQSSLLRKKNIVYTLIKNLNQILNKPQLLKRGHKPTHLEVSTKTNTFVYLFAPQRIKLPFIIDIESLKKLTKF